MFRDAVFVGCADEVFFLAQSGTKLYLMNSHTLRSGVGLRFLIVLGSGLGA